MPIDAPYLRVVLLGRYNGVVVADDKGADPHIELAQQLRASHPPDPNLGDPDMTDKADKPYRRKPIDLHPWTTKEERKTLTRDELCELRATRKADVKTLRERERTTALPILLRMAQRVGLLVDTRKLNQIILEAFCLLHGAQVIGDSVLVSGAAQIIMNVRHRDAIESVTLAEDVAPEIRAILIDQIDDWLRWEKAGAALAGMLRAFGAPIKASALVTTLEEFDGKLLDALLGQAIEDHIVRLLISLPWVKNDGTLAEDAITWLDEMSPQLDGEPLTEDDLPPA